MSAIATEALAEYPLVLVLDDDESVRRALSRLFTSAGRHARAYGAPGELMESERPDCAGCLVLDVHLPGIGGLEVHQMLRHAGYEQPVVFITGHGDVATGVRAMKAGAVDFIAKPFGDEDLLAAVDRAIAVDRAARAARATHDSLAQRMEALTAREHQVFVHVVSGLLNKQIAARLGITEKTVKVHRARVMEKMHAQSLAELVQIAGRLKSDAETTTHF
jgi:FixJ family two-component response regulator